MNNNQVSKVVLLTQGLGAVFFAVFWLAYSFALPSTSVRSGEPVFKIPLSIFGGLFLLLTFLLLLASFVVKRRKKDNPQ